MKRTRFQQPPPMEFDLRQLEIFKKVVELASFSKAAEAVFLAQASVSERIANLEQAVGIRLLDRLGRTVVPTKAGELLYKHAVLLLEMKQTAIMELREFLGMRRGEIHLGGSTIPGEYILPRYLGEFRKRYPMVSVNLVIADSLEIEEAVLKGDLELGLVGSKSRSPHVISRQLWGDELVVVIPAAHSWAGRSEVSISELSDEPFISREKGSGTLDIMERYLSESGTAGLESLKIVTRVGSSTAVKEAVKARLGISILSSRAVETEIQSGLLKTLKIGGLNMVRNFYLIRDKRRIASPLTQAMIDFLTEASGK